MELAFELANLDEFIGIGNGWGIRNGLSYLKESSIKDPKLPST
jgi:hypothetical protein